jgi:hypothetical protein
VAAAAPVEWAVREVERSLKAHGVAVLFHQSIEEAAVGDLCIALGLYSSQSGMWSHVSCKGSHIQELRNSVSSVSESMSEAIRNLDGLAGLPIVAHASLGRWKPQSSTTGY